MLEKLTLRNYRGFRNHSVPFESLSIIVGQNNAGKSTIVEALRLVSIVVNRAHHLTYINPPDWLDIPVGFRGVTPSLKGIDFDFRNVCHNYSESPAVVTGFFGDGIRVAVYINSEEEKLFAVITRPNRTPISSKAQAANFFSGPVNILPPIGPLARRERVLAADYVTSSLNTNLAPIHFRNQLRLLQEEYFEDFVSLAEESWEHLQITSLEADDPDGDICLFVRDGPFVAEVGWVGHGLQAWLQTIWFLARAPRQGTIILDEPDVYLHADLQRKLIRFLKYRYPQVIIATHSVEIMAEVEPESILIIDKSARSSKFATSIPGVQQVIEKVGGVHNLQLSRLWAARRCLFVEGKDVAFLSIFHAVLFPSSEHPIDNIPHIPLGGWGNWRHAIGATIGLKNAGDKKIKTYCILDSDYKTDEEKNEIRVEARRHELQLHIWKKKEIENYLLVPTAIHRFIDSNTKGKSPRIETILRRLEEICEGQKDMVTDAIATEVQAKDKKYSLAMANKSAPELVKNNWSTLDGKLAIVSGKRILSELSEWSKRNYGVSFGPFSIARSIIASEVHDEIKHVVSRINGSDDF
ncbi:MAG: AAA family ATPase [Nitrososphaera sp.]|nr:AAA family ATPase [Nitrososphaera sp.]